MIIGLTGTNAAGKGTVVDFLKEKGFDHFSVRGYLTERLKAQNLPIDRPHMQWLANNLRESYRPSFIIEQLYEQAEDSENAIIESIRCPGEITALRQKPEFLLFGVDADPKLRFERAYRRGSETDQNMTYEKFLEDEQRENNNREPFKQNLTKCLEEADIFLLNNGELGELQEKIKTNSSFDSQGYLTRRPTWDEIFMNETYTWAARSTCLRRKVGAVITTHGHEMVSQGYNGSPRGTPNCADLGYCERQKMGVPSGQRLETCRAVHAEPNAIVNAGRQGKNVQGDILYCTTFPCQICAGIIVNAGIKEIIYEADYPNDQAKQTFAEAKIPTRRFEGVRSTAFDKLFRQK